MDIVIVSDSGLSKGGASKIAIETAIGLVEAGSKVHLFCSFGEISSTTKQAGFASITNLEQIELINNKNKVQGLVQGIWNKKAEQEIKILLKNLDKKNTIIHVHTWAKSLSISPVAAAAKLGFKVIITLHDYFIYCPNGGFYDYQAQKICHRKPLSVSCITTNCDSRNYAYKIFRLIRTGLQKKMFNEYSKKITLITISHLSDEVLKPFTEKFKSTYLIPNPINVKKGIKINAADNNTCLYVGRLSPEKGIEIFCEALSINNKLNGVIAGDGELRNELEQEYPTVKFLGWQNKNDLIILFQTSRYLVFPSVWYETFGLVVAEAASYGIPAIVSDCTAARDLIEDNVTGLLFKSGDKHDLAEKMKKLSDDNLLISKLSENCYNEFWQADHTSSYYISTLTNVYKKVLVEPD